MIAGSVLLFLCGDVMVGRGIDQILPHPSDPRLHEPVVRSAIEYVRLAEAASGPIPRAVPPDYVWGEALRELARVRPALRIINLETSYDIGDAERGFAHRLIEIGFDIIHGHSSHHPKAIEIYRDRLILYGCGDFLNDYEGISGYEDAALDSYS